MALHRSEQQIVLKTGTGTSTQPWHNAALYSTGRQKEQGKVLLVQWVSVESCKRNPSCHMNNFTCQQSSCKTVVASSSSNSRLPLASNLMASPANNWFLSLYRGNRTEHFPLPIILQYSREKERRCWGRECQEGFIQLSKTITRTRNQRITVWKPKLGLTRFDFLYCSISAYFLSKDAVFFSRIIATF